MNELTNLKSRVKVLEKRINELEQIQKPKPIIVISVPYHMDNNMLQINIESFREKLPDYYTIGIRNHVENITFEVFYEKDFKEIDKKIIEEKIAEKF